MIKIGIVIIIVCLCISVIVLVASLVRDDAEAEVTLTDLECALPLLEANYSGNREALIQQTQCNPKKWV